MNLLEVEWWLSTVLQLFNLASGRMLVDPPIHHPRLLHIISTTEILMGFVFLPVFGCGLFAGYLRGYLEDWSWEKWTETLLEFGNYGILVTAGRYGRAAALPPIGHELHHFYLDFLSWNTVGSIISVLQIIIQTVEISYPNKKNTTHVLSPSDLTAKYALIVASSVVMVLILLVQCAAVSLDLIKWKHLEAWTQCTCGNVFSKPKFRNVVRWMMSSRKAGFSRMRSMSVASTCPPAQTTAQTSLATSSNSVLDGERIMP